MVDASSKNSQASNGAGSNAYTPEYVRKLNSPTDHFLCKLSDNKLGIKFGAFKIRDIESGFVLVDVKDDDLSDNLNEQADDPKSRLVKYHFGPDFLKLKTIGLTVSFSVGEAGVPSLQMIERHYFKN